jgi:hypothetical protein
MPQTGGSAARSRRRVRPAGSFPRAIHPPRQAHRSANPRRSPRQPGASVGARLLGAAAASESGRDRPQHQSAAGIAQGDLRGGGAIVLAGGVSQRRDRGISARSGQARIFFIEVNPRVQVEHTVTEVVTGLDIVKSQILIAQGNKLHEPPVNIPPQDQIEPRGFALQCRITTEDPENHFIPDYGRLTTYRSAAGFGIRLDGGTAFRRRGHHALLRFAAGEGHASGSRSTKRSTAWSARCASSACAG